MKRKSSACRIDIYQQVTDQIIEALESGVKPWVCPWDVTHDSGLPLNASTGNYYSGINIILLWVSAGMNQFSSSQWLTYKQAEALGGNIIKGERGTRITFYKTYEKETEKGEIEKIPVIKQHTVFNLDQTQGIDAEQPMKREEVESLAYVEDFFNATGASIHYGGQKAFYRRSTDEIILPEKSRFHSTADLVATLSHEVGHWTGARHRLDRIKGKVFGDEDYAAEELVAELFSAYSMADLGVTGDVQHECYIANWLQALKNDKRYVFKAASQASKAHKYVLDLVDKANRIELVA
ncbi:ArdC family protein [Vibrio ostreicida]|uniref:ArdC family protein n=1 Tax=Vibrio ostreicida TaxID=526588 RepID=UPI003B5B02DD